MQGGYPHRELKNNLTQCNMDGRKILITKSEDIDIIDNSIMDDLYNGLDIYIINAKHISTCEGNNALFSKLSHNNDSLVRLIFITDILKQEFKIMEDTYYTESRRGRDQCPRDPLDRFRWQCPVCGLEFDNM